jgi:hypothetical protein
VFPFFFIVLDFLIANCTGSLHPALLSFRIDATKVRIISETTKQFNQNFRQIYKLFWSICPDAFRHSFRCLPPLVLMPSMRRSDALRHIVEGIGINRARHSTP